MSEYPIGNVNGQLWYPRIEGNEPTIRVALYDVRSASDLVIGYDFDRDGWTIARDATPEREYIFIPAWPEPAVGTQTEET